MVRPRTESAVRVLRRWGLTALLWAVGHGGQPFGLDGLLVVRCAQRCLCGFGSVGVWGAQCVDFAKTLKNKWHCKFFTNEINSHLR
jgi:hypothetical protein